MTQAVIDMLKEWPEGETRSLRQMSRLTERNLKRHGINDDALDSVVSARVRERKEIFGISSVRGISRYKKVCKENHHG
jgi:hypothetical protein